MMRHTAQALGQARPAGPHHHAQRGALGGAARQDAAARPSRTGARRAALFASGLQPSDAPTAEVAAEAITATVRRFGSRGCAGRMAQEFGDHPDAAAERMRWVIQLTARMSARPSGPARAGCHRAAAGDTA